MTTRILEHYYILNDGNEEGDDHMRDQTTVLRNEIAELRQSLLRAQEKEQEIEYDRNFYRVKVSELTEILELKGGEEMSKLVAKSMENAELIMQVDRLKRELEAHSSTVQKLGEQRENQKRMLLELSGIVVALQSVQVDYPGREHSGHNSRTSLENVKAKVETIMEDRRELVLRCQELEKEVEEKDCKIAALEAQIHPLDTTNSATAIEKALVRSYSHKSTTTSQTIAIKQSSNDDISCGIATSKIATLEAQVHPLNTTNSATEIEKAKMPLVRSPSHKSTTISQTIAIKQSSNDDISCGIATSKIATLEAQVHPLNTTNSATEIEKAKMPLVRSPSHKSTTISQTIAIKQSSNDDISCNRHELVLRCQELEKEVEEKDCKIAALEAQFHPLNTTNSATEVEKDKAPLVRSHSHKSTTTLQTIAIKQSSNDDISCGTVTSKIAALEAQIHPWNTTNSATAIEKAKRPVVRSPSHKSTTSQTIAIKQSSNDDNSCGTATSATASSISGWNDGSPTNSSDWSPQQPHEATEINRLKSDLADAKKRYLNVKQICQAANAKLKDVEAEFNQVKQECKAAYAKRDKMRDKLKEVIDHYKCLHTEYDQTMNDLDDATSKIKALEKVIERLQDGKEHLPESDLELMEVEDLAGDVKNLGAAYLKAQRTVNSLKEKLTSAEREVEEFRKREATRVRKCHDAVADSIKLQYEKTLLESRITDAEEQLQTAKKEMQKYKEEANMRKEGILPADSQPSDVVEGSLMIPQLVSFDNGSDVA